MNFIEQNPDVISEGIWFVIQNKYELETENGGDYDIPARRKALTFQGKSIVLDEIPLYGDYDAFLWKAEKKGNQYVLVNRKVINGKQYTFNANGVSKQSMVSEYCAASAPYLIKHYNKEEYGTNVYTISLDPYYNGGGPFEYASSNDISVKDTTINGLRQAWVFQPMELVSGYEIPRATDGEKLRFLDLQYGYKLKATDKVSEWAMLNAHLIYKNMLNALLSTQAQKIIANRFNLNKDILIISKEDPHEVPATSGHIDAISVQTYRGGASGTGFTLITEEMMCKVGVLTHNMFIYKFRYYREFEQVVHEFAHTIDLICELNTSNPEGFAWDVQFLFNSVHSVGNRLNRTILDASQLEEVTMVFNKENSWIPPRKLREVNNLAFHRLATSSSDSHGGTADRAVDGDTHPIYGDNSVTQTKEEANPWWEVDLGEIYPIDKIVIWNGLETNNTSDGLHSRLDDFKIAISETPITNNQDGTKIAYSPIPWADSLRSQTININKRARYIRVFLKGTRILSLAEVEVFPEENPKKYFENPLSKLVENTQNDDRVLKERSGMYELGTVFSSVVSGKIFQVGSRMPKSGDYRITLWDFDDKKLLKSQLVSQHSDEIVAMNNLENPLKIEANKKYVISILSFSKEGENTSYYFYNITNLPLPFEVESIKIHSSMYSKIDSSELPPTAFPNGQPEETREIYGIPEFAFLPD